MSAIDLSVVVVNYNTAHLLQPLFTALAAATRGLAVQVVVVDNASRDDSVARLRHDHAQVEVIENRQNVGFARANNQVVDRLRGDHVLLLNTDAFVSPDTVHLTLAYLRAHPDVGVLGVRLIGEDGSMQPCCRYFPTPTNMLFGRTGLLRLVPWVRPVDDFGWDHLGVRECDWVPGCYYLMPKRVLDRVGLFDPRYFLYYEEVDHCKAVKAAGFKVVFFGGTTVVHLGGESAKSDGRLSAGSRQLNSLQAESEVLFVRKHHGLLGLTLHIAFSFVGIALLALRNLLKLRGLHEVKIATVNAWQLLRCFGATRGGARATR